MNISNLKQGDQFRFASGQKVKTTTYAGGQKMIPQIMGRTTKGFVIRVNKQSVRVMLDFLDKDRDNETCTLVFRGNEDVEVEQI